MPDHRTKIETCTNYTHAQSVQRRAKRIAKRLLCFTTKRDAKTFMKHLTDFARLQEFVTLADAYMLKRTLDVLEEGSITTFEAMETYGWKSEDLLKENIANAAIIKDPRRYCYTLEIDPILSALSCSDPRCYVESRAIEKIREILKD